MILFNKSSLVGNELSYMQEVLKTMHTSGDGVFTKKCNAFLEFNLKCKKALLTTSGTHALEMAAMLLNIKPGDEVIVPSFTFVTSASSFYLRGAKIVFADIRPDTLNINETLLENLITNNTKAIVPVHYAGIACEMDAILSLAKSKGIAVVEDNAQGLFSKYKEKYLGTIGDIGIQSFHETKNISCGEGGAIIINDEKFSERAEIIREKGTNRSKFFRGQVDKYTWVDIGSSYLPSEILAAFLCAQLEKANEIKERRKQIWNTYYTGLCDWAKNNSIKLPTVPDYCEQSYHIFYLIMPSLESRQELVTHLKQNEIGSAYHYVPLHNSPIGKQFGNYDCPVTEYVSDRLLRLPLYYSLNDDSVKKVIECVCKFNGF